MEKDPTESEKLSWLLVRRLLGTTWSMDVKWNFFVCLIDVFGLLFFLYFLGGWSNKRIIFFSPKMLSVRACGGRAT